MALLEKAAVQGHVYATLMLGRIHYMRGELEQSVKWVTEAGLTLTTLQLNLSATGGAVRESLGDVQGVAGGMRGVEGVLLCQKRVKLS